MSSLALSLTQQIPPRARPLLAFLAVPVGVLAWRFVIRRFLLKQALSVAYLGKSSIALLLLKFLGGKKPKLMDFQDLLPTLPVPKLQRSVDKWLASVKPLVTAAEYTEAEAAAKELVSSEQGKRLQKKLEERARTHKNYLTEWWVEFAYLRSRASLATNVSFYSSDTIQNIQKPLLTDPIKRAANMVWACLEFRELLETNNISPTRIRGTVPLCMEGLPLVFGTTRVPGAEMDELVTYRPPPGGDAHVLLQVGSANFKLPVIRNGKRVPRNTIEASIREAVALADKLPSSEYGAGRSSMAPVSLLSSMSRDRWSKHRHDLLASNPTNNSSIVAIEEALFAVNIRHHPSRLPENLTEYCRDMLYTHSDTPESYGTHCWFDKSFTIMLFTDGRAGWYVEHTASDAPIPSIMVEYVMCTAEKGYENKVYCTKPRPPPLHAGPAPPTLLQWDLKGVEVAGRLAEARTELSAMLKGFHYAASLDGAAGEEKCNGIGSDRIKKCGCSPDAFVQAAIQVAGVAYFGKGMLTYESAALRAFAKGRTETIRSASEKMLAIPALLAAYKKSNSPQDRKRAGEALREACKAHSNQAREAGLGQGCDRHLLALKLQAVTTGEPSPALFNTAAWQLPFTISTSQTPLAQLHPTETPFHLSGGGGFGPVATPGVGVSYFLQKDRVYVHCSARTPPEATPAANEAARFLGLLRTAFTDLSALFD
mmetsp:Transcript_5872/g.14085  ORF Transcript_5872/g.14085 Transcript_5872/m.14085 type:complete len:709 (+) Transcript_5872:140-2266(+)